MATRVPEKLVELYGTAEAADEAIAFFHRGPGRAVVSMLMQEINRLADLRYRDGGQERASLTDRAIVFEARLQASRTLESVVSILMTTREVIEGGGDEEAE